MTHSAYHPGNGLKRLLFFGKEFEADVNPLYAWIRADCPRNVFLSTPRQKGDIRIAPGVVKWLLPSAVLMPFPEVFPIHSADRIELQRVAADFHSRGIAWPIVLRSGYRIASAVQPLADTLCTRA